MPSSLLFRTLICALAGLFIAVDSLWMPSLAETNITPTLNSSLCQLCHQRPPLDIVEAGGGHQTKITCTDCHQGHPPQQLEIIPACQLCHVAKPHYTLDSCLSCHANPHRPLEVTFPERTTGPCLTCHEGEGVALRTHPSGHSQLSCTGCHLTHGTPPACTECHQPHGNGMKQSSCTGCHDAHSPTLLEYRRDVSSTECGSCHGEVLVRLNESDTRHAKLDCLTCHLSRHGTVMDCGGCHGTPHSETTHNQFNRCQDCHNEAHDLSI
ncbi:cytochrome C [Desulfuromonas sp. AOP6]|uniref:cytochrome C n=1 Tax=Desulfuromonas sp. AOP6 TaxID=1566351 RepID=UPI001274E153|nr:cytochrome C [Desulfuromonas sp. AOP6]BCA79386.1 cytochrome c [Desulfuromonas sp. AOP6]